MFSSRRLCFFFSDIHTLAFAAGVKIASVQSAEIKECGYRGRVRRCGPEDRSLKRENV